MNVTTARIEYRENTRGNGIFSVDFYGTLANECVSEWKSIELEREARYNAMIDNNKTTIKKIEKEAETIREKLSTYRKPYKFWTTKDEKANIKKLEHLLNSINKMREANEKLETKKYGDAGGRYKELSKFLKGKGFVLDSMSVTGTKNDVTKYEIWKHQS